MADKMVTEITGDFLRKINACRDGVAWFGGQKETDLKRLMLFAIKNHKENGEYLKWANWLIVRCMTRPQYLAYAIYAAKQVLGNFEKKYPDDNRPRLAIEAAEAVLKNDTPENRTAADSAARSAAYSADSAADSADSAADSAARSAYSAADSAAYSADSAAYSAAYLADSAAYSAAYLAAHLADKRRIKILKYGIKLLEGK